MSFSPWEGQGLYMLITKLVQKMKYNKGISFFIRGGINNQKKNQAKNQDTFYHFHQVMFDSRKIPKKEINIKKNNFLMSDYPMKNNKENQI